MRSLYKHPSGIWYGRVRDKRTNRLHKVSSRETQKRKAEQRILEWVEEKLRQEELGITERVLFDHAFPDWIDQKGQLRERVRRGYEMDFNGIYLPAFRGKLIDAIEVRDIEEFKRLLEEKRNLAPRTVQKHLGVLRGFFTWARRRKYCAVNPCEEVTVKNVRSKRDVVILSMPEAKLLLKACEEPFYVVDSRKSTKYPAYPPPYLSVAVFLALRLGLRKSNILNLRWKQVDFDKQTVKIHGTEMKNHKSHELPLSREVVGFLTKLHENSGTNGQAPSGEQPVIGQRIRDLKRSFRSAAVRADLGPDLLFHHLRHCFSSWLADKCTYPTLQALLGHSIPNSVTGRYIHTGLPEMRQALEKLEWLTEKPFDFKIPRRRNPNWQKRVEQDLFEIKAALARRV